VRGDDADVLRRAAGRRQQDLRPRPGAGRGGAIGHQIRHRVRPAFVGPTPGRCDLGPAVVATAAATTMSGRGASPEGESRNVTSAAGTRLRSVVLSSTQSN